MQHHHFQEPEQEGIFAASAEGLTEGKLRKECEVRAEGLWCKCLCLDRNPTMSEIDYVLEHWHGHHSTSRGSAAEGHDTVESDTFGLVRSRCEEIR